MLQVRRSWRSGWQFRFKFRGITKFRKQWDKVHRSLVCCDFPRFSAFAEWFGHCGVVLFPRNFSFESMEPSYGRGFREGIRESGTRQNIVLGLDVPKP